MSLRMNTNMTAINAARNLGTVYARLGNNTRKLSSGLRIENASDDPVNLVVRELMRADIASINQGMRNTSDGLSMIQTAEGALAVIDEKLIRMKELAEQAATATYTTLQRSIMNSEYQAMAAEIDRIANSTSFNRVKLLDGSMNTEHMGRGLKIHFGAGNDAASDYYFVEIPDVRATEYTGLRVGGDAKADQFRQNLGVGVAGLNHEIVHDSGDEGDLLYYYNYTGDKSLTAADLETPSYLAGIYRQTSGATLDDIIASVNQGTASRIEVDFALDQKSAMGLTAATDHLNVCLGDEVYQFGSGAGNQQLVGDQNPDAFIDVSLNRGDAASSALVAAVNANADSDFIGVFDATGNRAFLFLKEGGDHNDLVGCDLGNVSSAAANVTWTNVETGSNNESGANFSLGGLSWGRAGIGEENGEYFMTLTGTDTGDGYDISMGDAASVLGTGSVARFGATDFYEEVDAADAPWDGAEIRSQSAAQAALAQLDQAIIKKDQARAALGSIQNRLENTATFLANKHVSVAGAESRISDVDVAETMTYFTKDQIITQAAVSVLAQSNTSAQLALSLIL